MAAPLRAGLESVNEYWAVSRPCQEDTHTPVAGQSPRRETENPPCDGGREARTEGAKGVRWPSVPGSRGWMPPQLWPGLS